MNFTIAIRGAIKLPKSPNSGESGEQFPLLLQVIVSIKVIVRVRVANNSRTRLARPPNGGGRLRLSIIENG
jgi:hypothetical protein